MDARAEKYDACIFDFDGTLADTTELNLGALRAALAHHGITPSAQWWDTVPVTSQQACRERLEHDYGIPVAELVVAGRQYWLDNSTGLKALPAVDVAIELAGQGMPLAVASANYADAVRAGLRAVAFDGLFHTVITAEDVRAVKPAPDAYLLAARRLRVDPSRCLAYDNTDEGVQAAQQAGMTVVDVRQGLTFQHPSTG
ncbi:HAD family phosphatase [Saccharopolyspora sp. NPDC049426]|uniref:HAD family hydrolase n=1 Tax=Saccharopolyspora sp. NPDC049426 TaxID=3155652 RepID=UPI00342784F1